MVRIAPDVGLPSQRVLSVVLVRDLLAEDNHIVLAFAVDGPKNAVVAIVKPSWAIKSFCWVELGVTTCTQTNSK